MDTATALLQDSTLSTSLLVFGCIFSVVFLYYIYPFIDKVWSCINKVFCMLILLIVIGLWVGYGIVQTRVNKTISVMQNELEGLDELLN